MEVRTPLFFQLWIARNVRLAKPEFYVYFTLILPINGTIAEFNLRLNFNFFWACIFLIYSRLVNRVPLFGSVLQKWIIIGSKGLKLLNPMSLVGKLPLKFTGFTRVVELNE